MLTPTERERLAYIENRPEAKLLGELLDAHAVLAILEDTSYMNDESDDDE